MGFPGAYLVIIYTVLLHITILGANSWLNNTIDTGSKAVIFSVQGLVFISYPLIGLLADIKLTRYRMICFSCWVIFIAHMLSSVLNICFILSSDLINLSIHEHLYGQIYLAIFTVAVLLGIVGKGMFESTVIQFGTDQMIGASSAQLSTFIHWYYWSLYVGSICVNVIYIGITEYYANCNINIQSLPQSKDKIAILGWVILPLSVLQCILCCITLPLLYLKKFKKYLNIEPVGTNPIKQIMDVLKYAYHHKYPVRRSALSYYLNTYPSRIDFGKVQYGGPFTNEEVEDTKTVIQLLVLLLSLFGFHLSGDGVSTVSQILHKTCPSSLILLLIISNPSFVSDTITLLGIPILRLLITTSFQKCFVSMSKRMWFGLVLLCLQGIASIIISHQFQIDYNTCDLINNSSVVNDHGSSTLLCFISLIQYSNTTEWNTTDCVNVCPSSLYTMDSTLMWLLVPQILHGFGYMLVFVSVLEFICAQAPFKMKGFMVGIWYAMFSIKIIFINAIDSITVQNDRAWTIYQSIKIGIIGLSLIIFGISC